VLLPGSALNSSPKTIFKRPLARPLPSPAVKPSPAAAAPGAVRASPAAAPSTTPTVAKPVPAASPAAATAAPAAPAKPVVTPVLTSPLGAVALMPGLANLKPAASAADQMSALFSMLQTPEEVVRNSELVTLPGALQASLARLAAGAVAATKAVPLPADMQAELTKVLRSAGGSGTRDILVPAGSTGMVFSPQIQALVRAVQQG
jgi:hypothetical protein